MDDVGPVRHLANGQRRVLIAGGGFATLEAILALKDLAGEAAEIVVVAPHDELVYSPMTVAEPFGLGTAMRFDLRAIAANLEFELRRDSVVRVDPEERIAITSTGAQVHYDRLLVAVGANRKAWLAGAIHFGVGDESTRLSNVLARMRTGEERRIALVAPQVSWSLPLCELALMTAHHLAETGNPAANIAMVTPEPRPVTVFGRDASEEVAALLASNGIDVWPDSLPVFFERPRLQLVPDAVLFVDAVVALPRLAGAAPAGLPTDNQGFIRTDEHGAVSGIDGVYAAGDATTFKIKQGGIATQQADAAAAAIAASLGAPVEPRPFRPTLRGLLLDGAGALRLRERGSRTTAAVDDAAWARSAKVAGRYVTPYLTSLAAAKELVRP